MLVNGTGIPVRTIGSLLIGYTDRRDLYLRRVLTEVNGLFEA